MDETVERVRRSVRRFVERHGLLAPGTTVVVAVSGGPDSVCLLDCLAALAAPLGIMLHVAHLDHGLRADGSAALDTAYVAELATRYGLPVTCERRDVQSVRQRDRLTVQAAARLVRYAFLEEVASRIDGPPEGAGPVATVIATGHTASDQAETVILHLLRGSGLTGLAGMKPHRGRLIRPLLDLDRATVEAYCQAAGLQPRQDPSNASDAYTRNALRHDLLPALRVYNPRVQEALVRTATTLAGDLAYIEGEVHRLLPSLISRQGQWDEGAARWVEVDATTWGSSPPALHPHLVRGLITWLYGSTEGFAHAHITRIGTILDEMPSAAAPRPEARSRRYAQFPRHLQVEQSALITRLSSGPPPRPLSFEPLIVHPPVTLNLPTGQLTATVRNAWPDLLTAVHHDGPRPAQRAYLDADVAGDVLLVRPRRPGDTLQPLGLGGRHKKLQDLLVDARVHRAARESIPLVTRPHPGPDGGDQIMWVGGVCLADPFKVTAATTRVLCLQWQEQGSDA